MNDYYYPKVGGAYRHNLTHRCEKVLGRKPRALMDNDTQTIIRFDPDLDATEKILIDEIFSNPSTACDPPAPTGTTFSIVDIYDSAFRNELGVLLGCDVDIWFSKSAIDEIRPNRIEIHFSKVLSVQDKKDVINAVDALGMGWDV